MLKHSQKNKKRKGFTLIELLLTISIIGLITTIAYTGMESSRKKARDAQRVANLDQIRKALEFYYDANGTYPTGPWYDIDNCAYQNDLSTVLSPTYMEVVPKDPQRKDSDPEEVHCGYYRSRNSDQGYWISFEMETTDYLDEDDDCYQSTSWYCIGTNWVE